MKNSKRFIKGILGVIFLFLLITLFKPVDISQENCLKISGVVERLEEAGTKDIVFNLKDDPNRYYINRGLENGLALPTLEKQLVGHKIDLWHAQSWMMEGGHITQIQFGEELIYSEWGKKF